MSFNVLLLKYQAYVLAAAVVVTGAALVAADVAAAVVPEVVEVPVDPPFTTVARTTWPSVLKTILTNELSGAYS